MNRINLVRASSIFGIIVLIAVFVSCKEAKKTEEATTESSEEVMSSDEPFFEISLAQWSMHRMIWEGEADPYNFAKMANEWGFTGLEYVSALYNPELADANYSEEAMAAFVKRSNEEAEKYGMKNLLIMIDGQGNLAVSDEKERNEAVERHHKWVDAAAAMGCHAIRVNLAGSDVPEEWTANSIDGLTKLATYAKDKNINIIVENHGGLSSNAAMVAEVMNKVNMSNCGTLPDFGNFCIKRKDPKDYGAGCAEMYDIYKGVEELMVHAKAVSAKSHNFDADGNETEIDYVRMLQLVKDAGYSGHIGVEYEGSELSEEEGILATKELLLNAAKKVN
ncbi:sugar phosphate isomerase/epimerase family protein [Muriicola sp. Z0-33]|uniref:sugar phosphate isomerase/epimerase family protein n=1 Tax=Muriicola sp. Z0-33 TaxID=2816957 RepID=UPI0022381AE5|nr:sugar phosphate isomerase/epimerase family protein [Muriicola sp. Z0-33]MCW5516407.1 sugar phosphate isomerase/epimerase [Muriicola sp. Z0-33]